MDVIADLRQLEHAIHKAEGDGLHARWACGRYMLQLRTGKQLPRGIRATLTGDLGVHSSEVTARMKFAAKFVTEQELATAVSQFGTWHALKQHGLTTTPRNAAKPHTSRLQQVLRFLDNIDGVTLGESDRKVLAQIDELLDRIKASMALKAA